MRKPCDSLRELIIYTLSIFLLTSVSVRGSSDASIEYKVDGDGFHRTVNYQVDLGSFFKKNCYLALHLSPDPTLYVNVDELGDLRRKGKNTICSEGEFDVELFAHKARRQNITVCAPLQASGNVLSIPFHQRYRLPLENEEYFNVTLAEPALLLGCKERVKEYLVSKLDLCEPCVDFSIKWRDVPYRMKTTDFVWKVPVGDLSDQEHVTWVTLLTVWTATLLLLGAIWNTRRRKEEKTD